MRMEIPVIGATLPLRLDCACPNKKPKPPNSLLPSFSATTTFLMMKKKRSHSRFLPISWIVSRTVMRINATPPLMRMATLAIGATRVLGSVLVSLVTWWTWPTNSNPLSIATQLLPPLLLLLLLLAIPIHTCSIVGPTWIKPAAKQPSMKTRSPVTGVIPISTRAFVFPTRWRRLLSSFNPMSPAAMAAAAAW